jgi:hypothetical protein
MSIKSNTFTAFSLLTSLYIGSFINHPLYKGFNIGLYDSDKGHIEFIPDVYVTYKCTSYDRIPGYSMVSNHDNTEVTVNWGGLGRRKGLTNFVCKTK